MLLCTFDPGDGVPRAGLLTGPSDARKVLDLGAVAGRPIPDVGALLTQHPELPLARLFERLRALEPLGLRDGRPLEDVHILAPVPRPGKVTCLGLNYRGHAREQKQEIPKAPLLFAKARTAVTGPRGPIRIERDQEMVDYEVELCLVVGHGGFAIPKERWRDHILGYTVACDVSDRAAQYGDKQWYRGKSFPTFCPVGPFLALADAIDPSALHLTTRLNGNLMQDGKTDDLIFTVPEIVAYVSRHSPLEPGDLILTGTPAGVGAARTPPVFLRPGDRLECAIDGIGVLDLAIEAVE